MLSGHQHQTFRHLKKDQIKKNKKKLTLQCGWKLPLSRSIISIVSSWQIDWGRRHSASVWLVHSAFDLSSNGLCVTHLLPYPLNSLEEMGSKASHGASFASLFITCIYHKCPPWFVTNKSHNPARVYWKPGWHGIIFHWPPNSCQAISGSGVTLQVTS